MYCTRCGTENADSAGFCGNCGGPIAVASAPVAPSIAVSMVSIPHYAGFWLRFWAYLIDGFILGLLPFVVALIAAPLFFAGGLGALAVGGMIFIVPILWTEGWLYYAFMESSPYQATLGKKALGLKVTDMNGRPVSFGRATGRYFGKVLSHMLLNIGFIMAGFTQKKQALHDMLADCLVIRG